MSNLDFLKVAEYLSSVKKQEIVLPVARKEALVTPLLVGDDVALKTSALSPANYDRDIVQLLYKHTSVLDENKNPIRTNLQQFMANLSNIDKICLIWAIYKATYDTLGERSITCQKDSCRFEYKHKLMLDNLIQDDTFYLWDKDVPFSQYKYDIQVKYAENYIYTFTSKLPSILDNNKILSLVPIDALQKTLETTGDLFTRSERLTLLVDKISIEDSSNRKAETSNMSEILQAFDHYIPYDVAENLLTAYGKEFDKYIPKFYSMVPCPKCSDSNRLGVDLEVELFRRILFGPGEE